MKVERVLYFHSIQFFIVHCMKHLHKLYTSSRKRIIDNRVIIKLKRDWVEPRLQLPWSNCHLVISDTFFQQNGTGLDSWNLTLLQKFRPMFFFGVGGGGTLETALTALHWNVHMWTMSKRARPNYVDRIAFLLLS